MTKPSLNEIRAEYKALLATIAGWFRGTHTDVIGLRAAERRKMELDNLAMFANEHFTNYERGEMMRVFNEETFAA